MPGQLDCGVLQMSEVCRKMIDTVQIMLEGMYKDRQIANGVAGTRAVEPVRLVLRICLPLDHGYYILW